MRRTSAKIVTVGTSPTTVTLSGLLISEILVHAVAHLDPIYFRADGVTAVAHGATGVYVCNGYNGVARLSVDEAETVSVSLVSTGTGEALVVGLEAV